MHVSPETGYAVTKVSSILITRASNRNLWPNVHWWRM